jgi:hypothetical protein
MDNEQKGIRNSQQSARTWYLFAYTLGVLKRERANIETRSDSAYRLAAINASIILHITAIVEGAVRALLVSKIEKSNIYEEARSSNNEEILRLFNKQINQIGESAWKKLSEKMATNVLGYELRQVYSENWEWLQHLFQFRNLLAHGGVMSHKTDFRIQITDVGDRKKEMIRDELTKEKLFDFLANQKLIPKKGDPTLLRWNFLNSKVSDAFLHHAKEFLKALFSKIENDKEIIYNFKDDTELIQNL